MRWLRVNGRIEQLGEHNPDIYDMIETQYREYERIQKKRQISPVALDQKNKPDLEPVDVSQLAECVACGKRMPERDGTMFQTCGEKTCIRVAQNLRASASY